MGYKERKRWLFFGLPFTFTVYTVENEKLILNKGLINTTEDAIYLYKVLDTKLERSLWERIFGLGTVVCYTGDVSHKNIKLEHIKNAKLINDYIFTNSEEMRRRRRTLNTQSLTAGIEHFDHVDADGNGVPDCLE